MDWTLIASQLKKRDKTRVQTANLNERDRAMLVVIAKIKKKSLADDTASLLSAQVRKHQEAWEQMIEFAAAQEGLTPEELFVKLAQD